MSDDFITVYSSDENEYKQQELKFKLIVVSSARDLSQQ